MNPVETTSRAQTRENYDRLARWYDLFAGSEKGFTDLGIRLLAVQAGEKVLEIGFGTGQALLALAHTAGPSGLVAGVELSPGMIAVTKARMEAAGQGAGAALLNGDAVRLPFRAQTFDAVFLSFTLELFSSEEIPVVLQACKRVLQPHGRLGVVAMARNDALICRLYEWGHARWPSVLDCRPIDLRSWLGQCGWTVAVSRRKTMWGLPVEVVLARAA